MAEIVLATGSARPVYTTLALANAALPATPTGDTYAIELWNDSPFVLTAEQQIGNGASGYAIAVRPTAGHGYRDHANRLTNPLKYNTAYGVGIETATADIKLLTTTNSNVTFDGLQLKVNQSDTYNNGVALRMQGAVAKNCLIDIVAGANSVAVALINNGGTDGAALYNSVVIRRAGTKSMVTFSGQNNEVRNCTIVKTSDGTSGGDAIYSESGASTNVLKNTAIFGPWTNMIVEATPGAEFSAANSGYNATSAASGLPGSAGNVYNLTYANQFENVTTAAYDFRVKAGSGLVAGTRDQTYTADLDIVNSARSITTPTIGAREFNTGVSGTSAITMADSVVTASGTVGSAPKNATFSTGAGNELRNSVQSLVTATLPYAIYKSGSLVALGAVVETGSINVVSGACNVVITSASINLGDTITIIFEVTPGGAHAIRTLVVT